MRQRSRKTIISTIWHQPVTQLTLIALLLMTLWLYMPPYLDSFIGDDFVQQWRIRELLDKPLAAYKVLSPFWTDWYYRPLQNIWFLTNRLIFNLIPAGYYYLQLCWHLLAVSLIFNISRQLHVGRAGAIVASAFFAISGQHQLAIGWISNIGNVVCTTLSLAAFATFVAYLKNSNRWEFLVTTLLLYVFALLAHEQGFVLPFFLLFAKLIWPGRPPFRLREILVGAIVCFISIAYIYLQVSRPNANVAIGSDFLSLAATALLPVSAGRFVINSLPAWLPVHVSLFTAQTTNGQLAPPWQATIIFILLLLFLVILLRRASIAIRLGLAWAVFNLGFFYLALWIQRPELFDSRHLYSAWAGVCFVVGVVFQSLYDISQSNKINQRQRQAWTLFLGFGVILILFLQAKQISFEQDRLFAHTRQVFSVENQMKSLLPSITSDTRVFAARFILTPPYFVPAAGVWYGQPGLSGGSLQSLKKYSSVMNDFYLFDNADGKLYNLIPELQEYQRSIFLWDDMLLGAKWLRENSEVTLPPNAYDFDVIAGPENERRLAMQVHPQESGWASLTYKVKVPQRSHLAVAVFGEPGLIFRIRLVNTHGDEQTLLQHSIICSQTSWQKFLIPLSGYYDQEAMFYFELASRSGNTKPGYWTTPRIVID